MNFQNPYLNPYGIPQPVIQPMAQPMQPKQVDKVNGRNGAMQYALGPNSQAWILDENGMISWLIITDSAGYKTVTPYDVAPHEEKPAPDFGSLETRIKRLEEMIYDSADSAPAGRRVTNSATGETNDQPGQIIRKPAGHAEPAYSDEPEYETGNGDRTAIWRGRK